jgi:hypothetical protein
MMHLTALQPEIWPNFIHNEMKQNQKEELRRWKCMGLELIEMLHPAEPKRGEFWVF